MQRVKICGLRSVEDGLAAIQAGADAIGMLVGQVHDSPDFISVGMACALCAVAGPFVVPVLVTHLESPSQIAELARSIPCLAVQVHSDLDAPALAWLRQELRPRKVIGKVSVEGQEALDRARAIFGAVDALLVDSIDRSNHRVGGTGRVHDWTISARIVQSVPVPVILAGGLTPLNVRQAIEAVNPWGVDVNSGVKGTDGAKCPTAMDEFVRAAKLVRS